MIVKILTSLNPGEEPQFLLYDQTQQLILQGAVATFAGLAECMGDDARAFFDAYVFATTHDGDVSISLKKKLPEQGW